MPRRDINQIRASIRLGRYDMTIHAMEEMAEDGLDIFDFENSIMFGQVTEVEKEREIYC